jgi:hypothetical protein
MGRVGDTTEAVSWAEEPSRAAEHAVARARSLVEASEFYAQRGERQSAQLVNGSPEEIWKVLTDGPLPTIRYEYRGFDDMTLPVRAGVPEEVLAAGSVSMPGWWSEELGSVS